MYVEAAKATESVGGDNREVVDKAERERRCTSTVVESTHRSKS